MHPVSYTLSTLLTEQLAGIDILRAKILTLPLSPRIELSLRWQSTVSIIYGSLSLAHVPITQTEIIHTLTQPKPSASHTALEITTYANALRWISQHWSGNPQVVQSGDIGVLAAIALPQPHRTQSAFADLDRDIAVWCRYINQQHDHPIITAALLHAYLCQTHIGTQDLGKIARLSSSLLLAKAGYDLRGLAHPERMWALDPKAYEFALTQAQQLGQLTPWLEYIAGSMQAHFVQVLSDMQRLGRGLTTEDAHTGSLLTPRLQNIMDVALPPGDRITNRSIQLRFRISAITASRDLTKLHNLGLLYAHGKGRSVYYTRV